MLRLALLTNFIFYFLHLSAQTELTVRGENQWRIAFYNVENLFDTENDTSKRDDEFTPEGNRSWNAYRYHQKLNKLSRVIMAMGEWSPVEVLALAEIENKKVVQDLLLQTPLASQDYGIIHYESPDKRGIDVALIYLKSKVKVLSSEPIAVTNPKDSNWATRDILYTQLQLNRDTIHLWVNHWPSKYGGALETEEKRLLAANVLLREIESLSKQKPDANVLVMGDFNDPPEAASMQLLADSECLQNVSDFKPGTHKFRGQWDVLDQVLVSPELLDSNRRLMISTLKARVFRTPFMVVEDETHLGWKPYRTYHGFTYQGGFSDHLPIYVDLENKGQ